MILSYIFLLLAGCLVCAHVLTLTLSICEKENWAGEDSGWFMFGLMSHGQHGSQK